jgi:hypothetical protein
LPSPSPSPSPPWSSGVVGGACDEAREWLRAPPQAKQQTLGQRIDDLGGLLEQQPPDDAWAPLAAHDAVAERVGQLEQALRDSQAITKEVRQCTSGGGGGDNRMGGEEKLTESLLYTCVAAFSLLLSMLRSHLSICI